MTTKFMMIRKYSNIIKFDTFEERLEYLKLDGIVGKETFGHRRYMNQRFYTSNEWRNIRNEIIVRDLGCDLGVADMEIPGRIYIHHLNPLTEFDFINMTEFVYDPEYLICVSKQTHDAIHYGGMTPIYEVTKRTPNDTKLW